MADEGGRRVHDGVPTHKRGVGKDPGAVDEALGLVDPGWQAVTVQTGNVFGSGGDERIPARARERGSRCQDGSLSVERKVVEPAGEVVQDRPFQVRSRPTAEDGLGVVLEREADVGRPRRLRGDLGLAVYEKRGAFHMNPRAGKRRRSWILNLPDGIRKPRYRCFKPG